MDLEEVLPLGTQRSVQDLAVNCYTDSYINAPGCWSQLTNITKLTFSLWTNHLRQEGPWYDLRSGRRVH